MRRFLDLAGVVALLVLAWGTVYALMVGGGLLAEYLRTLAGGEAVIGFGVGLVALAIILVLAIALLSMVQPRRQR